MACSHYATILLQMRMEKKWVIAISDHIWLGWEGGGGSLQLALMGNVKVRTVLEFWGRRILGWRESGR